MEKKLAKTDMTYCTNYECSQKEECCRYEENYYFKSGNYSFCEFEESICRMGVEEAKTILEATIGEFKYSQSTLNEDIRELYEHGIQIQEIKALEIVLEALENSIPKKKIEENVEENEKLFFETKDVRYANRYKALKELLEDK